MAIVQNDYGDEEDWASTFPESQAGSQTGGSGAGLPGFDSLQVPGLQAPSEDGGGNGQANVSGPGVAGYNGPLPGGMSKEWADDFLRRNPKDEHRLGSAWLSEINKPADTQRPAGPQWQTNTGGGGGGSPQQASFSVVRELQDKLAQIRASTNPVLTAGMRDEMARGIASTLQQQGHEVTWQGEQLIVDGRPYIIPTDANAWQPTGLSSYKPGHIGTEDIPGFTYESLLGDMGTPEVDAFMSKLLANPESLDAQTVERMKAASKDELAELGLQDEARLRELGTSYGIQESPWLAAATAGQQAARGRELVSKNRDIEIDAAKTNAADRRAVGELGLAHANNRTNRVAQAANAALSKASATTNRLALREQVQQTAAELNMKGEEVLAQHIRYRLEDSARRYGMDLDATLKAYGIDSDAEQFFANLAQQDKHFQEELSLKMSEMEALQKRFDTEQQNLKDRFAAEHELALRRQRLAEEAYEQEYGAAGLGA